MISQNFFNITGLKGAARVSDGYGGIKVEFDSPKIELTVIFRPETLRDILEKAEAAGLMEAKGEKGS